MRNIKLSGRALVVQITEREIRIAQMMLGSNTIQEQVILPTPPNAVEDGQLVGLDALRDAMEPVLRQGLFRRCRKVVFSLCTTQVISETVTVPAVKKQQRLGRCCWRIWTNISPSIRANTSFRGRRWVRSRTMARSFCGCSSGRASGDAAPLLRPCQQHGTERDRRRFLRSQPCYRRLGAGFAAPKHAAAAGADADEGACLYVNAESELLLLTFVHNGQVKLQRLLQRGYSQQDDLNEVGIVLDYFTAMPAHAKLTSAVLSGGEANEAGLAGGAV